MRHAIFAVAITLVARTVVAAPTGVWHKCRNSARCREAYQQQDANGNEQTFNALYAPGGVGTVETDSDVRALLARVAHLGNVCRRNEVFVDGKCVCPDPDKKCGDVTPFNNGVIYAACALASVAIVLHVVHDVFRRTGEAHEGAAGGAGEMTSMKPCRGLHYQRISSRRAL